MVLLAPEPLRSDLVALLGERVLYRASDLVPAAAACCGYAGDRGLLHPELGMQQATGAPYRSIVQLLEEVTG